jgi:hypothetical protein
MLSTDKQQITLECGHTFGRIFKSQMDKIQISDNASWIILKNPVEEVRKAINDKDYFNTVTYACSVFEYCGQQILIWHTKNTVNPLTAKKVKDWKLQRVINELHNRKLITDTEANKLHSIRDLRNDFVHEDLSIKITSTIVKKVNALNDDIIYHVGYMKEKYDKSAAAGV